MKLNDNLNRVIEVAIDHLEVRIREIYEVIKISDDDGKEALFFGLYLAPVQECDTYEKQVNDFISAHETIMKFFIDFNYFMQADNYEDLATQQFFKAAFAGQLCEIPEGEHARKAMIDALRNPLKQQFFEKVKEIDQDQKYLKELDPIFEISAKYEQAEVSR